MHKNLMYYTCFTLYASVQTEAKKSVAVHTICAHTANIIMVAVYGMNMQQLQLALAAAGIAT